MSQPLRKAALIQDVFAFQGNSPQQKLPLFVARVAAGFPSPADDFIDKNLDLGLRPVNWRD